MAGIVCLGAVSIALARDVVVDRYGAREMLVYAPAQLPPAGSRALVVVLHGGLGNAQRIESKQAENGLNMDAVAERNGFIVAYLNGTPVTRRLGDRFLGWNAGGCCGESAANRIDDVGYIAGAVAYLADKYGIDRNRVYGMGHSNGAMMTQRLMCETNLYAAAVAISGPLDLDTAGCPAAKGKRILAIHGADDQNVPVQGGAGAKGLSRADFKSEAYAQQIFTAAGATYTLDIVKGADHALPHIDEAVRNRDGLSIAERSARFFGLAGEAP
jgi:polyhydroxybutyrate depolymerase